MGAALQALVVAAVGALTASLTYAAVQYFLFLGQVLRLVGAEERWVGDPPSEGLFGPLALSRGTVVTLASAGVAVRSCAASPPLAPTIAFKTRQGRGPRLPDRPRPRCCSPGARSRSARSR